MIKTSDLNYNKLYKNAVIGLELELFLDSYKERSKELLELQKGYNDYANFINFNFINSWNIYQIKIEEDASLNDFNHYRGAEIIFKEKPIKKQLKQLESFLIDIEDCFKITSKCGLHCHISFNHIKNTKKLGRSFILENAYNHILKIDTLKSIKKHFFRHYSRAFNKDLLRSKYHFINTTSKYNTLELRYINALNRKKPNQIKKMVEQQINTFIKSVSVLNYNTKLKNEAQTISSFTQNGTDLGRLNLTIKNPLKKKENINLCLKKIEYIKEKKDINQRTIPFDNLKDKKAFNI